MTLSFVCAMFSILLDHGARVDLATNDKSTALIAAAENGHDHIVRQLLTSQVRLRHLTQQCSFFLEGITYYVLHVGQS